jgi:hypothetical protein
MAETINSLVKLHINGTEIGSILNLAPYEVTSESVPTYTIGDTFKTYRPSQIKEGGDVTWSIYTTKTNAVAMDNYFFQSGNSAFMLTFPGQYTSAFSGHFTSMGNQEIDRDDTENVIGDYTVKVCSKPIRTAL